MTPFPLPLGEMFGWWGSFFIYLTIGIAFGAVLEMSGFGYSPKLAAQFYFKDLTVLKVMFTAIIVAMVLIFSASALGLLDYNLIWVNPTYLWPGIVGGLIMGVGFIVGGFCPGTSLVAAATFKLDGIFFSLGALFGIFLFGETVGLYEDFYNSSYMGRLTIQDWLGADVGLVALGIVLMALFMFWGGEQLERIFGKKDPKQAPKWRYGAAGVLLASAVGLTVVGQPTTEDRWAAIAPERQAQLDNREVQIHPGELITLLQDDRINTVMLDVRSEADYNQFHLIDARHVPIDEIANVEPELLLEPASTVFVVMSNDETAATEAWKHLVADSIPNVYILEGGINGWLDTFSSDIYQARYALAAGGDDLLRYRFDSATGSRHLLANPVPHLYELTYETKVKLENKRGASGGGCG